MGSAYADRQIIINHIAFIIDYRLYDAVTFALRVRERQRARARARFQSQSQLGFQRRAVAFIPHKYDISFGFGLARGCCELGECSTARTGLP